MHSSHVPFTRILVSEPKRLAIVNNHFHMPRTKAVFDHVFDVSAKAGEDNAGYDLRYFYVENALPPDVLKAGMEREAESLPKFMLGENCKWPRRRLMLFTTGYLGRIQRMLPGG